MILYHLIIRPGIGSVHTDVSARCLFQRKRRVLAVPIVLSLVRPPRHADGTRGGRVGHLDDGRDGTLVRRQESAFAGDS